VHTPVVGDVDRVARSRTQGALPERTNVRDSHTTSVATTSKDFSLFEDVVPSGTVSRRLTLLRHISKAIGVLSVVGLTVALGATAGSATTQSGENAAGSGAQNAAHTSQSANQGQNASSSSGANGCSWYCTGGGGNITAQSQFLGQGALTAQWAGSEAYADQNAVNANVPVTIVGWGDVSAPSGGANQRLDNSATSIASNDAATNQHANQRQGSSSTSGANGCEKFCTGGGGNITPQSQDLAQLALTEQQAQSQAAAKQNAVNANVPVTIVGWGNVNGSSGSANQQAGNAAASAALNSSATNQNANQQQQANGSSGSTGGGFFGSGGGGNITPQSQQLLQHAGTVQSSLSSAGAQQWLTNAEHAVGIG
jgi:hypothetical protein